VECKCDRFIKDDPSIKAKKKTAARKSSAARGVNEL
jgi:hypothetical protein